MLYWGLKAFCMRVEDVREWLLRVVCCARSRGLILPYCLCPSAGMWSSYAGKVVAVSICCHFKGENGVFSSALACYLLPSPLSLSSPLADPLCALQTPHWQTAAHR